MVQRSASQGHIIKVSIKPNCKTEVRLVKFEDSKLIFMSDDLIELMETDIHIKLRDAREIK